MATTYRAGIEYKRLCPASLTDGTINIGEFKYEDGSSVGTITLNESLNTIGTSKEGEKEKHTGGYYGKAHITKADNCTIRQRAVLINKHVYEKGLAVSEEISGMSTADMLLWNDKKSSNTISGSLRIGAGNDCSTIDSAIYRKDGRGASVRMTDPTSLKLFLTNAGSNKDYINLMFQGFLFNNLKGLHGYLVDDIIQSKYSSAPSIRSYIDKTDNVDDEKFAVYEWQRKVWFLMNTTQENNTVMSDDQKARKRIDKMMEKANRYRESITDTTYLQTTVEMSYSAIDALNTDGYNDDYISK